MKSFSSFLFCPLSRDLMAPQTTDHVEVGTSFTSIYWIFWNEGYPFCLLWPLVLDKVILS